MMTSFPVSEGWSSWFKGVAGQILLAVCLWQILLLWQLLLSAAGCLLWSTFNVFILSCSLLLLPPSENRFNVSEDNLIWSLICEYVYHLPLCVEEYPPPPPPSPVFLSAKCVCADSVDCVTLSPRGIQGLNLRGNMLLIALVFILFIVLFLNIWN